MATHLDQHNYILFSTRKKNGDWVDTPVWFAPDANYIYIFSAADAGKVKRLRNFSEVYVAPCNVVGKPRGERIEGSAELLESKVDIAMAHKALIRKYGWQMRWLDFGAKLSGRYYKRAFARISLSESH